MAGWGDRGAARWSLVPASSWSWWPNLRYVYQGMGPDATDPYGFLP
jgi:hypothetical protein